MECFISGKPDAYKTVVRKGRLTCMEETLVQGWVFVGQTQVFGMIWYDAIWYGIIYDMIYVMIYGMII